MIKTYIFYLIQFYVILATPHINLHHSDWTNENEMYTTLLHDCLYLSAATELMGESYQTMSYCLTEWPSKWNIFENNNEKRFTFAELYQQNITSEQLYLWSASMKLIEDYETYRNQRSLNPSEIVESSSRFYNCTSPRFGPQCQYSLDTFGSHHSSLNNLVHEYYCQTYKPPNRTCYIHLECNRGSTSVCLGWYEICDGIVDCFNDGFDEKYCWQLKLQECNENEYQCKNGQCIPKDFYRDSPTAIECLDESDQLYTSKQLLLFFPSNEPTFFNEDLQFIRYKNIRSSQHGLYSTVSEHIQLLKKLIFIETPNSVSDDCWLVFKCYFNITKEFDPKCENHHFNQTFIDMINITCPEQFLIPATPIAFSHIYFLYFKELIMNSDQMFTPHYICYNHQYCHNFLSNRTLISFNNLTCRKPQDFPILFNSENNKSDIEYYIKEIYKQLYQCNTVFLTICNNTKMYQCFNSLKCIFADQLCDGIKDCDYHDDEYCPLINDTCVKGHFKCRLTEKCISIDLIYNDDCDCSSDDIISCEDRMKIYDQRKDFIPFSSICDSYTQLNPVLIDNRYETDETDCDHWQCNNTYTRCDSKWNCWNGADEINCNSMLKCPFNSHQCVSPKTYKLICLPLEQAGDGRIDCVGATDEPKLCRSTQLLSTGNFYCINNMNHTCIDSSRLCSENNRCMNEEDEQLCSSFRNLTKSNDICSYEYSLNRTEAHTFFCDRFWNEFTNTMAYFKLNHMEFPKKKSIKQIEVTKSKERFPLCWSYSKEEQRCYRGLPIHVWLDSEKNRSSKACLCPPSYYGEACQYDRQRISLTLKFQVHSDSRRTLFTFVVILIDNDNDQRIIYSYEQYTYFYQRDCSMKYNIYLLHPISSFLFSKNYSIHIDVYEKIGLTYRGSFFIPIKFSFLPVNRIATQLIIPRRNHTTKTCSNQSCHHGQCINYINDRQGSTFCQCYDGWYGKSCTIRYTSQCSSHSLSIGVAVNNQSVCVCPINRWGSRCLLWSNTCQQSDENSICKNGGQCIPDNKQFILSQSYICVCRRGFSGTNCEDVVPFINLTFHKEIHLPQSIIIHFIHDVDQNTHLVTQSSDVQRITFYQKEIIIYWTTRFNIAIAQLLKNYYLILVQNRNMWNIKKYNQTILPSYRCKHVSEVLNETILSYHQFRRVKYYQIPCEKYAPDLNCFYDDDYFCLCYDFNHQRLSNCFNFNSKTSQTCYGLSDCENNGECIQNDPKCPKESICVCPKCFHGTLCQFSSHSFGLSLDAILGYYIQPNVSLIDQLFIIKMSLTLTIIISILGIINSIISFLTFKNQELQQTGCGLYLMGSSVASLFTMVVFILKFIILLITQMNYMTNDLFLKVQCYTLDFLLRTSLCMDQYLNACVASERAFTAFQGVMFNKKKSKQMAKYIIIMFLFWTIVTTIHDPIHRRLLYDNNHQDIEVEKRIWCIVKYSSQFQIFDSIFHLIHFFVPFLLNLLSAFIIIIATSKRRRKTQCRLTYQQILQEQFREHKNLLIAPIVLVLLTLPRLIFSFMSDCMNSTRNIWLPLSGYFISFIPPLLTFVIFVLPSRLYMKEFKKSLKQIRLSFRS